MPRTASELTLAMRKLFGRHKGKITYTEAIPKLIEMGQTELVASKPEMSEELSRYNQAARDLEESTGKEPTKSRIVAKAKLSREQVQEIDKELEVRGLYESQENYFNVNKSIWKRNQTEGSRKPETTNGKAAAQHQAKKASPKPVTGLPKPKHRRSAGKVTVDTPRRQTQVSVSRKPKHKVAQLGNLRKVLEKVEQHGGMEGIDKRLAKIQKEADKLKADTAKQVVRLEAEAQVLESLKSDFNQAKSAFDKAAA